MLWTILAKKFLGNPGSTFRVFKKEQQIILFFKNTDKLTF